MSKRIGDRLPDEIVRFFDGKDLEAKVGPAHLLVTADEDGVPRPCMLSAGEILVPNDRSIRVALWPESRTTKNLASGGTALFCYVAPGSVLYVRATPRSLSSSEETRMRHFELRVESVESDLHKGMPVTEGLMFAVESMDPATVVESWEKQLVGLREARVSDSSEATR
ncbi:MAG: hypothetical protein ACRDMV_02980 [Streptosporangiales bacterium]